MNTTLLIIGITCEIAAAVGGGLKLAGTEFPLLASARRQALLAVLGLAITAFAVFLPNGLTKLTASVLPPTDLPPNTTSTPVPVPDACVQGFVWRDAFSVDHVCVTPQTREQAAQDNAQAAARVDPAGGAFGSDTCQQGFVWREASPNDHVCVTPETHTATANDNAQGPQRRVM